MFTQPGGLWAGCQAARQQYHHLRHGPENEWLSIWLEAEPFAISQSVAQRYAGSTRLTKLPTENSEEPFLSPLSSGRVKEPCQPLYFLL